MAVDTLTPILYVLAGLLVMVVSNLVVRHRLHLQREILKRGIVADGKVTLICGGATKRVYFEYSPAGSNKPLQCCHIDRRETHTMTSLPTPGTSVQVRYLPENPRQAVIMRLARL